MLAAISYTTFPTIELGPFSLRTFGLMVALGVLLGASLGSRYGERFGVNREDTYRTGTLMVLAGIVGARLTWVVTHWEELTSPTDSVTDWFVDVIAIWRGGIQFAGGFIAALIVGWPMFRRWTKVQRWHVLNGYAWGLTLGVAIGRIGCYSVGEHFGRQTDFFLATRYEGGSLTEPTLGDTPLLPGMVFHNTSLYELIQLAVLFGVMGALILLARRKDREVLPVTLVALFMVWYGVVRFLTDTLRVNDDRVLSMTGAQWMSLVMVPYGVWLFTRTRPKLAKLVGPDGQELEGEPSLLAASDDGDEGPEAAPDELEAPEEPEPASADVAATGGGDGDDADTSVDDRERRGAEALGDETADREPAPADPSDKEPEPLESDARPQH